MRIGKILHFTFYLLPFTFYTAAFAQPGGDLDTLQVEIIKEYQPSLSGAMKITENPRIKDTIALKPNLSYSLVPSFIRTEFSVEPVQPVKIKGEPLNKLYGSNLKAAIGNYTTSFAEFTSSALRSREYSAGARLKHFSSSGQINNRGYSGYSDNLVHVFGKRFLYFHTLSGDASWNRNVVHYYGYDPNDYNNLNDTIGSDTTGKDEFDRKRNRQRFSVFSGKVNFGTNYSDSSHVRYSGGVQFNTLNDLFESSETNILILASGSQYIGKELLTVNLSVDHYANSFSTPLSTTNTIVFINPVISSKGSKYRFDIGLNSYTELWKSMDANYYFYPMVFFAYHVFKEYFIPYASLNGTLYKNSMKSITAENPFFNTDVMPRNSYSAFYLKGGIKGQLSKLTTYDVDVSGGTIDSMAFFVNDYSDGIGNRFTLVYDNAEIIRGGANLMHVVSSKIKLALHASYAHYTMDKQDNPWHRPAFETRLTGFYNVRDKIRARCDIYGSGGYYARVWNGNIYNAVKVKGFADVNLSAEYIYNKYLSAFINFNNIGAVKYERYYRYPSQRFQFLLGVSVSF